MEDDEQPPTPSTEAPASAPKAVERALWVMSRDEQRVLIITFVGGLASIIAGVCVIGGAIAATRFLKAHFTPLEFFIVTAAYSLVWVLYPITRRGFFSFYSMWLDKPTVQTMWVFQVVLQIGVSIVLLLVWIGIAAGIH